MLRERRFQNEFGGRAEPKGWLAVITLATFKPIGDSYGIPAVERAADHLGELIAAATPQGALAGRISWTKFGVFLPGATVESALDLLREVRTVEDDLEWEPGLWLEIRAAVGAVKAVGGDSDAELIAAATRLADWDMTRFPAEWQTNSPRRSTEDS
jgi:GGDEF domain-containing protein